MQQIIYPETKEEKSSMKILLNNFVLAASKPIFSPTVLFKTIDFNHAMRQLGICSDYVNQYLSS